MAAAGVLDPDRLAAVAARLGPDLFDGDRLLLAVRDFDGFRVLGEAAPKPARTPFDDPLLSRALGLGRPVAAVFGASARPPRWLGMQGTRSLAAAPLAIGGTVLGCVVVASTRVRSHTAEEMEFLELVAAQLGPALHAAQLHARLLTSERRLRAVYDSAPFLIASTDLDGNLISANTSGLALFGYTSEEFRRLTRDQLIHPEDVEIDRALHRDLVRGRIDSYATRKRYLRQDGTPFTADAVFALVRDAEGRPDFYISIVRDLTWETEAAAVIERSRDRARAITGLSHDLRTPLNSILGFAELLERAEFGMLNPRQQRYVGHIKDSGKQLLELVDDIVDLQRADEGRLDLDLQPVEVRAVMQIAVDRLLGVMETRGLEIGVGTGEPLLARADGRRLLQVLQNLLGNAAKFTPAGGWIWVDARADGDMIRVDVSDSGIGISPEEQSRIFEEYTQAAASRAQAEGSGLGLALSRRLVEAMGGHILVSSEQGRGSTFSVLLPAA